MTFAFCTGAGEGEGVGGSAGAFADVALFVHDAVTTPSDVTRIAEMRRTEGRMVKVNTVLNVGEETRNMIVISHYWSLV